MRLAAICIERPVLTSVMSLLIVLAGALALGRLPNRELPDVDPPVVSVTTLYPGAAPEVVETSVTEPLEDALNGIAGVKHMRSESREQLSSISVEFDLATEIEAATNDVRDRVSRARNKLPDGIDPPQVAKRDADASPILWLALYGADYDQVELTNIAENEITDRIGKLPGVASVVVSGERRFSMRVWIDNRRLAAHDLAITEVVAAMQRENVDIPSGRVEGLDTEFTVRSLGELRTAEEFGGLLVANVGGRPVRLRDVADVETGPESERKRVRFNLKPAIGLGVIKQSKANELDVAAAVRAEVARIASELDPGVTLEVGTDSARFIEESIRDVKETIFEAAFLVLLVIYVFLRTARATIVPALAIPVSIIGTFAVLQFAGYTINTLTLMGVTLAIGLVVDDAIVVLENITRWIESGTPPFEAARRGMDEIAFAVVAATISAVSVFLPLTFMRDVTGQLFREFAVTVASAIAISGFVAVTLTPMLCARILRPAREERGLKRRLGRAIDGVTAGYVRWVTPVVQRPRLARAVIVFALLWVGAGFWLYAHTRQELMPDGDRSFLLVFAQAPEGSTVDYMERYQHQVEELLAGLPEARAVLSVIALGIGTPGLVNEGMIFADLVTPSQRTRTQQEIQEAMQEPLGAIPGIQTYVISASPMRGFGSSPVELVVQGADFFELARIADDIEVKAGASGLFKGLRTDLFVNKPQVEVSIDRERANDLGVSVRDIATTLRILLGGLDISTFKQEGDTYNVMAQLRSEERQSPRSLGELFVRGHGGLIPLDAVVESRMATAPRALPHFDRRRAVTLTSDLAPGVSQGEGLQRLYELAEASLPAAGGYQVRYSGEAEKFFEAGEALLFAYGLAIVVVFLVLAAQFESFLDPVVILVAVFLSFTGALVALRSLDVSLNIFSKIGIVMLVGLVTKNSILIVEFANQLRERGLPLVEATIESCRTRFRPVLMTALATMVGILPIAAGLGAGGGTRQGLGVAVVGGMLFSTALTFFVVPAAYVGLAGLRARLAAALARRRVGQVPAEDVPAQAAASPRVCERPEG